MAIVKFIFYQGEVGQGQGQVGQGQGQVGQGQVSQRQDHGTYSLGDQ